MRLRIEAAARALRASSASVMIITARFFFATSQHFAVCFKKYLGVTPTVWRRQTATKASSG